MSEHIPAGDPETEVAQHAVDGARALSFTIYGPPRTKKNHGWRTKSGKQMPSHSFAAWNRLAQASLACVRSRHLHTWFPITEPINCRALFYRDAERGDAVGYYQALADALEDARILDNDSLVVSWDGSRLLKDRTNPRIEVHLEVLSAPGP